MRDARRLGGIEDGYEDTGAVWRPAPDRTRAAIWAAMVSGDPGAEPHAADPVRVIQSGETPTVDSPHDLVLEDGSVLPVERKPPAGRAADAGDRWSGKGLLWQKMSGDDWQRAANLRGLYAFMHGHRGKKLLFMGGEFGQTQEWYHERSLDWHLLETGPYHRGLRALVRELNRLYRNERALHEVEFEPAGFQWIDCDDAQQSVVSFVPRARDPRDFVLFVCNFTAVPRLGYRVGAPGGVSTGNCSTPTPRTTAGAISATRGVSGQRRAPGTDSRGR